MLLSKFVENYLMQKYLLSLFLLITTIHLKAQDYFSGLIGDSYIESSKGVEKKVNKTIYIVYNRNICTFYAEGQGAITFRIRNYRTELEEGYMHTSFISEETNVTPDGHYWVMIDPNKNGTTFQVALPTDFTYLVMKTRKYSENGEVKNNAYIQNWKELNKKLKAEEDSLIIVEQKKEYANQKKKIEDSLVILNRKVEKSNIEIKRLEGGDNSNNVDIRWLRDTVISKVKSEVFFSSDFKILIDKNGVITNATPKNLLPPEMEKYVSKITNVIKGQKTEPFKVNGQTYPSFANVYISIPPEVDSPKKGKKQSLKLLNIIKVRL